MFILTLELVCIGQESKGDGEDGDGDDDKAKLGILNWMMSRLVMLMVGKARCVIVNVGDDEPDDGEGE